MKKIIILTALLTAFSIQAEDNINYQCIKDSNNFIIFYPYLNKWGIITDKPIKAAKRASGIETLPTSLITSGTVQNAPEGSKMRIWTQGAVENRIAAYIEPLCYSL